MNEIMKLTEKGLAKLAAATATNNTLTPMAVDDGATGTAGEVLEQADAADGELAAVTRQKTKKKR